MSKPLKYKFVFSDGTDHDASVSEISESWEVCFDYGWSLFVDQISLTSFDSTWTIEVSNDDNTFYNYKSNSIDIPIIDAYDDIHLSWTYMRINYNSNTESTGTVEFEITLKS